MELGASPVKRALTVSKLCLVSKGKSGMVFFTMNFSEYLFELVCVFLCLVKVELYLRNVFNVNPFSDLGTKKALCIIQRLSDLFGFGTIEYGKIHFGMTQVVIEFNARDCKIFKPRIPHLGQNNGPDFTVNKFG